MQIPVTFDNIEDNKKGNMLVHHPLDFGENRFWLDKAKNRRKLFL